MLSVEQFIDEGIIKKGRGLKFAICEHGFIDGVEYCILLKFGTKNHNVIIVRCPKCGKWGKLTRYRNRFRVVHNYSFCSIPSLSEHNSAMKKLYNKFRNKSVGGR